MAKQLGQTDKQTNKQTDKGRYRVAPQLKNICKFTF